MTSTEPRILDGHNDILCRMWTEGGMEATRSFVEGRTGALDQGKARAGGFGGGFFAVYVSQQAEAIFSFDDMDKPTYDLPLPPPVDWKHAIPVAVEQVAMLYALERMGALEVCRDTSALRKTLAEGRVGAILHLEGAEAIDEDLHTLEVLYQAGLRSLGPVWSRNTLFAHGVPFRFPSTPDIGEGLTEQGIRLVRRCNELGILIDLSHINEAGFWDVARHTDAPLVATHSNAHAICPHSRNLTDNQLRAIRDSGGVVGLNFAVAFLREDGRMRGHAPLSLVLRHLDHLIEILGEDGVGFGSDYEGAIVPADLRTVADLPNLRRAMQLHGYGETLIRKLCHENWLRVLDRTWRA